MPISSRLIKSRGIERRCSYYAPTKNDDRWCCATYKHVIDCNQWLFCLFYEQLIPKRQNISSLNLGDITDYNTITGKHYYIVHLSSLLTISFAHTSWKSADNNGYKLILYEKWSCQGRPYYRIVLITALLLSTLCTLDNSQVPWVQLVL